RRTVPVAYGFATALASTNLIEWRMTRPKPFEESAWRQTASLPPIPDQSTIYVSHVYQDFAQRPSTGHNPLDPVDWERTAKCSFRDMAILKHSRNELCRTWE